MSLSVPLTVRVGDTHITKQVQSLSFRKEAIGGVRSISFGLSRSLIDLNGLDPLAKVYVYDGRSGATVAEGRFSDPGRSAGPEGQKWDCVAFGPAQHASDDARPLVYVDRTTATEAWVHYDVTNAGATLQTATQPGATSTSQGLLMLFGDGITIATNARVVGLYTRIWQAGQKIAAVFADQVAGLNDANWRLQAVTRLDGTATGEVAFNIGAATAGGATSAQVVTNFPNGRTTVELRWIWTGGAAATTGDTSWGWFGNVRVRSMLLNADGTDVTTGYTVSHVLAHEVVRDLLGRMLPEFDGAAASVSTNTAVIEQLAYPDTGVTAAQVLEDLMKFEPAYRWYATPDATGNGYGFHWEPWPTTVRYEATLDDGGSFPLSTQTLYNRVSVKWTDSAGFVYWSTYTNPVPLLDDAGIVRRATIDLGNEVGTLNQAAAAATAFFDQHAVPKNSGTLTVARPIRDVITGAQVQPWEIEPGELVRIKGVEAYPDAFNADTNDGQGVFRIFANDYTTEGNVATLALDSDPRETEDALVKLLNQRSRR